MKKNVIVSVSSVQSENEDDNIEIVTPGKFYKKEKDYYVAYDETKLSGMEGTTTTFKISSKGDKFSLIRIGTTSTKMEFEKQKEQFVLYDTPYGTLELKLTTKNLDINVDEDGGNILIDYTMAMGVDKPLETTLKINIKPQ
ncbi:DUF1934 domain-containing protein [Clostridium cochlearium]|jgi:uncharacterized beta-barrel protein YwiB (DUF1934 family)|uniref:Calycin-like domain-containing protein n=1 Tax=Clostridium cochlearium TaxID=1494 RepID=A0A239YZ87_CLOCO|nr:DUF1934 domain-containing protein [Clostridium cochlearium]MBV1818784.1 DUF1934 domain-containing protein [Bacteroidales bacterium MSK.15.36]NSJ91599.1 DUF1934 domain-containing protein [Coprococcus sp. MSK.21.13]MBE6065522.1 DUF1934 domain-containing protein [Clostridium cochlearium]MBU5270082.1 DUF1934 domain-containing protein [Clostridium cochlearium]MCG4572103.1 DUF1934 domain-containing protein [Clostridium cochlearium]